MKKITVVALLSLLIALVFAFIAPFFAVFSPFIAYIIPAVFAIAIFAVAVDRIIPDIAKAFWRAESEGDVLVLLEGEDKRIHAIPFKYMPSTNLLVPLDHRINIRLLPEPDSVIPIAGHRTKLALAFVDYPFTLPPDAVILAYDLKLKGISNLDQAILAEGQITDYMKQIEALKTLYNNIGACQSFDCDAIKQLGTLYGVEINDSESLNIYREKLRQFITDLEATVRTSNFIKKLPIVKIGARIYKPSDIASFLPVRIRLSKLNSLLEAVRMEERIKQAGKFGEIAKYSVLIIAIFAGLIAFIFALGHFSGSPTTLPTLPNLTTIVPINPTG